MSNTSWRCLFPCLFPRSAPPASFPRVNISRSRNGSSVIRGASLVNQDSSTASLPAEKASPDHRSLHQCAVPIVIQCRILLDSPTDCFTRLATVLCLLRSLYGQVILRRNPRISPLKAGCEDDIEPSPFRRCLTGKMLALFNVPRPRPHNRILVQRP